MSEIPIKQGASLQLAIQVSNDDGSPMLLSGLVITAQVRTLYGSLVDTLVLTPTGTTGQLSVVQSTAAWPTGRHACDLKIVEAGITLRSDTFNFLVSDAVTA